MTRRYELRTFAKYLPYELLKNYFISRNYPFDEKLVNEKSESIDVETYINGLEQEIVKKINLDFAYANELSTEDGILSIVDYFNDSGIDLQVEVKELENPQSQALYTITNYSKLFENAFIRYYADDLTNKKERIGIAQIDFDDDTLNKRTKDMEYALQTYLMANDGRGQNCKIELYRYQDRICFLAYPEDYLKTAFRYNPKGTLERTTTKDVFEIIYIYYPEKRKLELSCKLRSPKRVKDLMKMFGDILLEDDTGFDDFQKTYELNKLLEEDFNFYSEPEDKVEYIRLKKLRLANKYDTKERITIETDSENEDGMLPMREALRQRNVNAKFWFVNQATIKLKYEGTGNKGGVTTQITFPDGCTLNDTSENHRKTKRYLELWGLTNGYGK